jgi:very-short-patch-repair endonuclease
LILLPEGRCATRDHLAQIIFTKYYTKLSEKTVTWHCHKSPSIHMQAPPPRIAILASACAKFASRQPPLFQMNITDLLNLQTLAILGAVVLGTIVLIKAAKSLQAQKNSSAPDSAIKARRVLTAQQQPMYFRLREAFPDHIILTQVAFSALLETWQQTTRDKFDGRVAGFVVCTKEFEVVGVIELDDLGRQGREAEDASRDLLLAQAGYEVLRYKEIPSAQSIRDGLIPAGVANRA